MDAVPFLFGLALMASLWFAEQSGDRDVRMLALTMIAVWALMNIAWLLNAMWAFPLLDLWAGAVALPLWWTRRTHWAALFVKTIFVRLELHVLDGLTGHAFLVPYIHALNATFAWMLVVVAFPGGGHGFLDTDYLRRHIRRLRGTLATTSAQVMPDGH